jgi:hypothetical protein
VSCRAALVAVLALSACRRSEPIPDPGPGTEKSAGAATRVPAASVPAARASAGSALPTPPALGGFTGPASAQTANYRIAALSTRRCPPRAYERFGPGRSRLGVELAIEATGSRTIVVDAYYARIHDAEGREYAPTFGGCEPDLRHTRLSPGGRTRGWVSFEWSDKATPVKLTYSPDLGDAGRAEPATLSLP